jgi:hypothetical protein
MSTSGRQINTQSTKIQDRKIQIHNQQQDGYDHTTQTLENIGKLIIFTIILVSVHRTTLVSDLPSTKFALAA